MIQINSFFQNVTSRSAFIKVLFPKNNVIIYMCVCLTLYNSTRCSAVVKIDLL